ncbi:MAG TPA: SBBP repeat-containing protein [Blastocatellia bacterium]|nr:SBBP repeat-containing protein [Blastocatellia bacterium]
MKLTRANPRPEISGEQELPGRSNYFTGRDPSAWRTNIRTFARVRYGGVYKGVDMVFYGRQGQLEYDFIVEPGASPKPVEVAFEGAEKITLEASGDLLLETAAGCLRQHRPVAYQETGGIRREVAASYIVKGNRVGFRLGEYDPTRTLVIDPVLSYSTFLGGDNIDEGRAIAVDSEGNAYVAGLTASSTFPATEGAFQNPPVSPAGFPVSFISKIDPSGTTRLYSTFLSATVTSIAIDSAGNVYATGGAPANFTFPTTPGAFQPSAAGGTDAFVTKLNATGSALVYSTFLGGNTGFNGATLSTDAGIDIAVDAEGNAYVAGETFSRDFPTTQGAFRPALASFRDGFITKLNPTGAALVYSTYLGDTGFNFASASGDQRMGIAVDSAGHAYVTGTTSSRDFPVVNALQPNFTEGTCGIDDVVFVCSDAYVIKMNPTGTMPVYSTYLGGRGQDEGRDVTIDSAGNAYVTGIAGPGFPTTAGAFQTAPGGRREGFGSVDNSTGGDAFVAKINAEGASLVYSTYLGGGNGDRATGVAVDSTGNVHITGSTTSSDFPVTANAIQAASGSSALLKSLDGANAWASVDKDISDKLVLSLAIDPVNPAIIYAGTQQEGIFKSTDAGNSWASVAPDFRNIAEIVIDPADPATIFAGGFALVKSTDAGNSWTVLSGQGLNAVNAIAIDHKNRSIIYAGTGGFTGHAIVPGRIHKSTDGGATWQITGFNKNAGLFDLTVVHALVVDPNKHSVIHAGTSTGVFRSKTAGKKWKRAARPGFTQALVIDPQDSSTIYAGGSELFRNTRSGAPGKWLKIGSGLPALPVTEMAINAQNPMIIYASTGITGLYKSTDGGLTFQPAGLNDMRVFTVGLNPQAPSTLYAGGFRDSDVFVATLNAAGSALLHSTHLGARPGDRGSGISLDGAGDIYITGVTFSSNFPVANALQPGYGGMGDGFVTKISLAGP